ncbi:hypothetical protein DESC_880050 [Desulfosarcina cetonica]|nr:hypothetical protein DESC_880050 [Desulfosarcina cetonica]
MVIVTTEFSLRGYWRTLRDLMACSPAIMITRLTTRANTGRRMKGSVSFMALPLLRFRGQREVRCQAVVDDHRLAVAQLESTGADHHLARLQSGSDGDEIAAFLPQPDKLLAHHAALTGFPIRRRGFHHEHRIAVRRVKHGRGRNGEHLPDGGQRHSDPNEHPWTKMFLGIDHRGLHADIARGTVHHRVDGGNTSRDGFTGQGIGGHIHRQPALDQGQFLLGQLEIDENRIHGLQHDDGITFAQVLTQVDLTQPQPAGEGCPDGLLGDRRPDGVHLGGGLFESGLDSVEIGPGDHVFGQQFPGPLQVEPGQFHGGLGRAHLGRFGGNILLNQKVAPGHSAARLEFDARHLAGNFRGNRHALNRFQGTHGRQRHRPAGRINGGRGHRRRWGGHLLSLGDHAFDLQPFYPSEQDHQDNQSDQGEENCFFHWFRCPHCVGLGYAHGITVFGSAKMSDLCYRPLKMIPLVRFVNGLQTLSWPTAINRYREFNTPAQRRRPSGGNQGTVSGKAGRRWKADRCGAPRPPVSWGCFVPPPTGRHHWDAP